jgi:hypothetical protein
MPRIPFFSSAAATGLFLAVVASPIAGQESDLPTISGRYFASGSAKVTVSGAVRIDQEVPINTKASFGDGEMTWVQFGASGSEEPNVTITYQPTEVGIVVGKGKFIATAEVMKGEKPQCSGKTEVTETSVTAHYTCPGIPSHDAATGKMGKVDIDISFTAKS